MVSQALKLTTGLKVSIERLPKIAEAQSIESVGAATCLISVPLTDRSTIEYSSFSSLSTDLNFLVKIDDNFRVNPLFMTNYFCLSHE